MRMKIGCFHNNGYGFAKATLKAQGYGVERAFAEFLARKGRG